MPLMHCMECHHEWESTSNKSLCDWCGAGGYILEKQTSLDKSIIALRKKKEHEKILRKMTGKTDK